MQILLCAASALFGLLSLVAAASQIIRERKPFPAVAMGLGSLVLLAAVACNIRAQGYDYAVALLGCAAICVAAVWNGLKSGQFHPQHHIIRLALSILLVLGFVLL